MKFVLAIVTVTTFRLLFFPLGVTAQIKHWTDEQGVTHFGNRPPEQRVKPATVEIKIRKSKPFNIPSTTTSAELRRAGEAYLNDLESSLVEAQLQTQLLETIARTEMIGMTGLISIQLTTGAGKGAGYVERI